MSQPEHDEAEKPGAPVPITETERPKVRGTAVGGQYISPRELFTTRVGREALRSLIRTIELEKSRAGRENPA